MIVKYQTSVFTPAGWRGVTITAEVAPTGKMATVIKVLAIDGEQIKPTMSRTGAKRQQYHGTAIASREEGKRKRLSACEVLKQSAVA
jgi:hypothetical protein